MALSKGWFSSTPSRYKVVFAADGRLYQINGQSQRQRAVRRIGTDDDELFRRMALEDLDEADTALCFW